MIFSTLTPVPHDGRMDASRPRFGGPTRRRSFTPAQKLDHVAAYEAALTQGGGGAYLRQEGLYSSQITEWRRLRDAGVLAGKSAGAKIGRPTAEQTEIARLRRQLDLAQRRLSTTERPLHRQRRDTVLGRGELPADLKPHRQRRPTSVEQRARRHRRLSLASGALEAAVRDPPTPNILTSWADEPVRPAQPLQIVQAVRVRGEP